MRTSPKGQTKLSTSQSQLGMEDDEIQYPLGIGLGDVVAWRTIGLVVLDEPSRSIINYPFDTHDSGCVLRIPRERRVYYGRFAERGEQCRPTRELHLILTKSNPSIGGFKAGSPCNMLQTTRQAWSIRKTQR